MLDKVQIRIVNNLIKSIPTYATKGSAGLDLRAAVKDKIHLRPNETVLIPTGLSNLIENQHIFIPQGAKHRLANRGDQTLVVIEMWFGEILDENDIKRYED